MLSEMLFWLIALPIVYRFTRDLERDIYVK